MFTEGKRKSITRVPGPDSRVGGKVIGRGVGLGQMARGSKRLADRETGLCRGPEVESDVVGLAAVERE